MEYDPSLMKFFYVFRTVVRQQSKIVKGDIVLITKAPEKPWEMEAMGRFVAIDKAKVQKGSTSVPTEMQAWLSNASVERSKRKDFELQADLKADLEDDESDSDSDKEDGDDCHSIPEGMDKNSPDLKHTMDMAGQFSPPMADLVDKSPPMPQSITELANCEYSPLRITPQQNTLETVLDKLATIDLGVEQSPSTPVATDPEVLQSKQVKSMGDKEPVPYITSKGKQKFQENLPLPCHNLLDLKNRCDSVEPSGGKQLTSTKFQALSRKLFTSNLQPSKATFDVSSSHEGGRSQNKPEVADLSAPTHIALFSPRKLRSRKPRKPPHGVSDENDSDNPNTLDSDNEQDLPDGNILGSISPTKLPPNTSTFPPSDDHLIETPTMVQLGFSYNIRYNLVICNECQSGISFTGVPDHAYKGAIRLHEWDTKRNVWTWIPGKRHDRPKIMKSQARAHSAADIQGWILKELEVCLKRSVTPLQFGSETNVATRMAWIAVARPHPDQMGPISGLRVFKNAFKCTTGSCKSAAFPNFGLVPDSIRMHAKTQHPGMAASYAEGYTVQSMTHYVGLAFYFEVTEPKVPPLHSKQQRLNQADVIHEERQRLLGRLEKSQGLDQDLIHEAFGDVGMKKFWMLLERDMIAPLYDLDENGPTSHEDKLLRMAVVATFFDITRHVGDAHPSLLHLIAKGAFFDKLTGKRKFTIPDDNTLSHYVLTEIQFLRWMIYAFTHAIMDQQGKCIFDFNQNQMGALEALIEALHAGHSGEVAKHVVRTFHAFYFPANSDRAAFNSFAEPLNAFFALLCLRKDGTPRTLSDSSHYCARLQFAIRLRGYHHLFLHVTLWLKPSSLKTPNPSVHDQDIEGKAVTKVPHTSETVKGRRNPGRVARNQHTTNDEDYLLSDSEFEPSRSKKSRRVPGVRLESHPDIPTMDLDPIMERPDQSNWWCDFAIPFCSQYLTAYQLTPYAFVRESMRVFSYAISKKRKTATTFWKDDSTVIIGPHTIDVSIFRSFLSSQIERLEEFFRTELLFGKRLDELGITVDFSTITDTGDMESLMYSPLLESINGNSDSDILLDFMLQDRSVVEINPNDNKMRWHAAPAEKWLGNIHTGASRLQAAAHTTQGAPGRMSEEAKMQATNTEVGRRHLVVLQSLNTLAIWSNYSKTTKVTGAFKEVLRVYPHRISRLIFILIRLIRPIEILYVIKHRQAQIKEESELVATTYKSKLWTSFGTAFTSELMCDNLADFLTSEDGENPPPFTFHFGVRVYREFSTAVQRRHIRIPIKYSRAVAQQGMQVGDLQAGRSTETSLQNYAVEKSVIDMEPGFTGHYVSYSRAWQRFWGLDLEGKDDVHYFV